MEFITQNKYTKSRINRFKMNGCKTVMHLDNNNVLKLEDNTSDANNLVYKSLIGSILYLTTT